MWHIYLNFIFSSLFISYLLFVHIIRTQNGLIRTKIEHVVERGINPFPHKAIV